MEQELEHALRIMQKHQQHCQAAHGDNVSAKCDTCKEMMLEFMDALGMDPSVVHQLEETYGVPEHFKQTAEFFNRIFPKQAEGSAWD